MIWPFNKSQTVPEVKEAPRAFSDLFWPVPATKSGIEVTPAQALKQPTAYACFRIITETVAQLPLHAFQRDDQGVKSRDTSSAFNRMFTRSPNEWTTAFNFKLKMTGDVILYGNAFALIVTDSQGAPRFLKQIPSRAVRIDVDVLTGEPRYVVTLAKGGSKTYRHGEIIHLSAYEGLSPINQAREAIGVALAQEAQLAKIVQAGLRPAGVLTFETAMSDDAIERTQRQFTTLSGEYGTAILDGNAKYQAMSLSAVDQQFLEMRRHQVAEIARAFRVPLHMLQELERITHQNAEQLGRQFLQFTMLPWLKLWEEELNLKLGTGQGDHFFEFLTDDLAKADLAARMEAFAKAISTGILNPNEVRQLENRAPYVGGDDFLRPLNMEASGDDN